MPPQVFYSFDDLYLGYYDAEKQINLTETFKNAGVSDQVKMITIAKSKNVLIVRSFGEPSWSFRQKCRNLDSWFEINSWRDVERGKPCPIFKTRRDIQEMSLTANMELSEMLSRKILWKTVDDKKD